MFSSSYSSCGGTCVLNRRKTTYEKVVITYVLPPLQKKKKPVDFDGELKIGDVRYDNITKITIKVQLF